jgi:hypothetical protein
MCRPFPQDVTIPDATAIPFFALTDRKQPSKLLLHLLTPQIAANTWPDAIFDPNAAQIDANESAYQRLDIKPSAENFIVQNSQI